MVVQHNMQAMNANRMLGVTTGAQAKSTEKLSSGYKINRAADDAAGLTISEKMRRCSMECTSVRAPSAVCTADTPSWALVDARSRPRICFLIFSEMVNPAASSAARLILYPEGIKGKLTDKGGGVSGFELDKALENGDKVTIGGKEYTIGTSGNHKDAGELNTSTDGYLKSDNAVFTTDTLSAGDSVTYQGNTYTLTDKVAMSDITWKATDTFTIGDESYTVVADTGFCCCRCFSCCFSSYAAYCNAVTG